MGPSGSGKTTLLSALALAMPSTKGMELTGLVTLNGAPAQAAGVRSGFVQQVRRWAVAEGCCRRPAWQRGAWAEVGPGLPSAACGPPGPALPAQPPALLWLAPSVEEQKSQPDSSPPPHPHILTPRRHSMALHPSTSPSYPYILGGLLSSSQ